MADTRDAARPKPPSTASSATWAPPTRVDESAPGAAGSVAHAATLPTGASTSGPAFDATVAAGATAPAPAAPRAAFASGGAARSAAAASVGAGSASPTSSHVRSTVLPRALLGAGAGAIETPPLPRYERKRLLGAGGVGEVALAHDHDIDRVVAVKRLRPDQNNLPTLLRFAEEVRTIGRLEHPNIVPIHDVGIDEDGQHYFVMKYVEGETLETIIARLRAGDEAYARRFSYEVRAQVFLSVLQAVQYAHARGIVHRDIKPANIMVGPFGEVMVMDWGLAKKIRDPSTGRRLADEPEPGGAGVSEDAAAGPSAPLDTCAERDRLFKTRHGALLGTPAYMSPEQAMGRNAEIDERSDVYSLCVLFHELLTLRHYLADQATVGAMLVAIATKDCGADPGMVHGAPPGVPAEYMHVVRKGVYRDPDARYQSVAELAAAVQAALNGEFKIQCGVTMIKRTGREVLRGVDRNPRSMMVVTPLAILVLLYGVVSLVMQLARLLA